MAQEPKLALGRIPEETAWKIMVFLGGIPGHRGFLTFLFQVHKKEGVLLGGEGFPEESSWGGACPPFLSCSVRPHTENFAFEMCDDPCPGFALRSLRARGSPENGQRHASGLPGAVLRMC